MSDEAVVHSQEWQRSIDDPFGSDAVDILTKLTPSPAKPSPPPSSPPSRPIPSTLPSTDGSTDDSDAFMSRLDVASHLLLPLSPSLPSSTSASGSSASLALSTPRSAARPSIYEDEEEDVRSSQDEALNPTPPLRPSFQRSFATRVPPPPPSRRPNAASPPPQSRPPPPPTASSRNAMPLSVAHSESWLRPQGRTQMAEPVAVRPVKEARADENGDGERDWAAEFPDPYAAEQKSGGPGFDPPMGAEMGMGFTSGSGRKVVISAGALAIGAQLMQEVEAEFSQSAPRETAGDDGPLQSFKSAGKPSRSFQSPSSAPSLHPAVPRAAVVTPSSTAFRTPAKLPRVTGPMSPPRFSGASSSSPSPAFLSAAPDAGFVGFKSGSGAALPPVSEASMARAKALMAALDAEEEKEAAHQPRAAEASAAFDWTVDGGAAAESFGGFTTGAGAKVTISEAGLRKGRQLMAEVEQDMQQRDSFLDADDEKSAWQLPERSGRRDAPQAQFTSASVRPSVSTFRAPARQVPRPLMGPVQSPPPPRSPALPLVPRPGPAPQLDGAAAHQQSKSARFDAFLAALDDGEEEDDDSLLPPVGDMPTFNTAAASPTDSVVEGKDRAALLSLDRVDDDFHSYSSSPSSSTESTTASHDRPPPSESMCAFQTGAGRKVEVQPDSWAKAQRLLDSVDKEMAQEAAEAGHQQQQLPPPVPRRPFTSLSSNTPHLRPVPDTPLLRSKPPLTGKENTPHPPSLDAEKPLLRSVPRQQPPASAARPPPQPFRAPVSIARPSTLDSPLPSPGLAVSTRRVDARRPLPDDVDAASHKKRRLTFNTPRPHITAKTAQRTGAGGEDEPNLLKTTRKAAAASAAIASEVKKHADLSLPAPPLPSLDLSTPATPFSCVQYCIERLDEGELLAMGLSLDVIHMTATSALDFTFPPDPSSPSTVRLSPVHVYHHLVQLGCDPSLFSLLWVRNHYRWVVWKLAALERSFPSHLAGRCLTYPQLLRQMKRRYDRQLDQAQRSALALILERDESPGRYLVLCIAAIFPPPDRPPAPAAAADDDDPDRAILLHSSFRATCHVVLTDGHHSVPAKLDPPLLALLRQDRLPVGLNLRIFNASLTGDSDGTAPLENDSTYLQLHANSTRRAPRRAKLGLQKTGPFSVSLRGVVEGGGGLPCVYAVVGRVYPVIYLDMGEDGSKTHRTQRAEDLAQEQWKDRMARKMDDRRAEWEAKMDTRPSDLFASPQPTADYTEEEQPEPRKVIPYLKVRLHELIPAAASPPLPKEEMAVGTGGEREAALLSGCECIFTVWRPTEADMEALVEGSAVAVYGALVSGRFDGLLRLSTARSTPIIRQPSIPLFTSMYPRAVPFNRLSALQSGEEFDCVMSVVYETRYTSTALSTATRHLYGVYDSEEVLMVEVVESAAVVHLPSTNLPLPSIALMTAVKYGNYDSARRVHVAHATKESQLRLRAAGGGEGGEARKGLNAAWTECKEWFDTRAGDDVRVMQRERVRRLVEDMDGGADACDDAWYAQLREVIRAVEVERAQKPQLAELTKIKVRPRLLSGKCGK